MPAAVKPERHPRELSFVSLLSDWAQQGVQSLFATQRILLDLAMRQNASVMHAFREQLSHPHNSPTAIFSEMAGEGINNFIEGQKVLLELAQEQNEILMNGVKERIGEWPGGHAVTDMLRRSVDTFIDMQQEFLKIAHKQSHQWVESAKTGKPFEPERLMELGRESMESFIKAQKEFLDVIADETAKATGSKRNGMTKKMKKTELAELARQATQSFIDAQKKMFDVVGRQMNVNVKSAGKTLELLKPFPFVPFAELTREGVKSYVDAQKALMDAMLKGQHPKHEPVHHSKRPTRGAKKEAAAAGAA
jgi:hypothetical protein